MPARLASFSPRQELSMFPSFIRGLALAAALAMIPRSQLTGQATPPDKVDFMGSARSPIASSVGIPANAAWVWTSGTVPSPADTTAAAGTRARFGDTKTQAISVIKNIEGRLKERGLALKDVVYLRVYLVADKEKGAVDFAAWNEVYGMFFNNATNPTKTGRSTIAVAALVYPDLLIEIEAFAVYPPK
jgi:enamine deaminase RidA (YjgF/YER057c/UK114 family)